MTSVKPKLSSLRQYSLRSASPQRPELKKQSSVDSTKTYSKTKQRSPPQLQWQETNNNNNVQIIAKKCSEYQKPKSVIASPQRDPVLYSRQELAERLRKVWKDRETNNNNNKSIDIFLAQSISTVDDETTGLSRESSSLNEKNIKAPLKFNKKPEALVNVTNNQANNELKQKNISRKISLMISPLFRDAIDMNDGTDLSSENNENFFENSANNSLQKSEEKNVTTMFETINKNETNPLSAELKRESFKRISKKIFSEDASITNNSTTPSNFRPPLVRAQSVPAATNSLRNNHTHKHKFPAKRRAKTATLIHKKSTIENQLNDGNVSGAVKQPYKYKVSKKKNPVGPRCRSATTTSEIVTMVSITSPPHSDTEENVQKTAANLAKIRKQNMEKKAEMNAKLEAQRLKTLRKIVKQVSFQPTLVVPPLRNHSANSYLSRRSSIAPVPLRTILQSSLQMTSPPTTALIHEREKRTQLEPSLNEEEGCEPKRRFLQNGVEQTGSIEFNYSAEEKNNENIENENIKNDETKIAKSENIVNDTNKIVYEVQQKPIEISSTESISDFTNDGEPKFKNPKESQCWKLYKKMCDKGVDVSYDTILKGILTPTEYRLRQKIENNETIKKDEKSN